MRDEMVIDADGHVIESDAELLAYLPPPYRRHESLLGYPFFPTLDGFHRAAQRLTDGKGIIIERPTAASWGEFVDQAHVAVSVLFPTAGLSYGLITDPQWAAALAYGYNNWLHDRFIQPNAGRIKGMALIPVQDPALAVEELRRAVTELGMLGAILPAVGLQRAFGAPEFWPIYEAAQELNVVLAVHGAPAYNLGLDRFQKLIEVRTLTHPFSQMIQLTSLMFNGVFDTFPRLRVAFCEAGAGWVPFMAERLDLEYGARSQQAPALKRRPTEHLAGGQIFVHCELDELGLARAIDALGRDDIFFCASDYPHELKTEFPEKVKAFRERRDISEQAKRNILWHNPVRMYNLDETALRAVTTQAAVAAS
jgi:predicted TIM-barrel fold metal-dependent hydrolase